MTVRFPLIDPHPPRASELGDALRRIEASGTYSNNGPELRAFEAEVTQQLFGGIGASLGVANATLGLTIAIRQAAGRTPRPGDLALVPALTFAATGQAAAWAGLTPLIADIDPDGWALAPAEEERLLKAHGDRLRVIVPYATFGAAIDLERYAWLSRRHGVGVVVDAAASLGTLDEEGRGFGAAAPFAVVFSMHATKTFAVGEGGLIHSGDPALIARLRAMANFGFESGRNASLPGLNAKLSEVSAMLARAKLVGFDQICDRRTAVEVAYRAALTGFTLQQPPGRRQAMQFMPVLLPLDAADRRDAIAAGLEARGIGSGRYFSPHLGEQDWFRANALVEPTPVADDVGRRMLSLPITDTMMPADATKIAAALRDVCAPAGRRSPARVMAPPIAETMLIGGGPAGTAVLTAAAKAGLLGELARGLVVVERDAAIGGGRLGGYAITSDSTAQTFLSAVCDNPEPSLAALADHPSAQAVARYEGGLGVPLVEAGPLLRATGDQLATLVGANGGEVLTGHQALGAEQEGGLWRVRLRRADGQQSERLARTLVIATGGHQPLDRLAAQRIAGRPLVELAGERLMQSDQALALGGTDMIADLLAGRADPHIAVIGGSTSALATVALLLKRTPALPLGAGAITLLHRRPLRPFYPSAEAAVADGYADWGSDDVCPISGFVYRLAGFRLEARELVLRMLAVGGRRPDPRVRLHRLRADRDVAAWRTLRRADLVIAALGYRPHALPLLDAGGRPLALAGHGDAPLVDRHCRVVDEAGSAIPGVFAIGLAAGFVPWGELGGEASFVGQANGLWLWQNAVGRMIVDQLLARRDAPARAVA